MWFLEWRLSHSPSDPTDEMVLWCVPSLSGASEWVYWQRKCIDQQASIGCLFVLFYLFPQDIWKQQQIPEKNEWRQQWNERLTMYSVSNTSTYTLQSDWNWKKRANTTQQMEVEMQKSGEISSTDVYINWKTNQHIVQQLYYFQVD